MVCQLWMELNENEYQPHSHEDKHGQNGQNAFAGGAGGTPGAGEVRRSYQLAAVSFQLLFSVFCSFNFGIDFNL